jgi:hypothetical protein
MKLTDRLAHLAALKAKEREDKKRYEGSKAERERFELDTHTFMESEDLRTVRTGSHTFSAKETIYGQVQDEEAFRAWVRDNELEDEFFRSEEVKGRINELVREAIDSGRDLPPGLGWYPRKYVSATEN